MFRVIKHILATLKYRGLISYKNTLNWDLECTMYAFTDCSCDKECTCLILYIYLLKGKIGSSVVVLCSVLAVELKVPVEGVTVQWALSVRSNVEQSKMSVPPKTSPCFLPGSTRC